MQKKATILAVEDESILRERLVKLLVDYRFAGAVYSAANGCEAMEKIETHKPHVVISDIVMPGMSGIELMQCCHQQHPEIEFILLSGHKEFSYAQQAVQCRAANYLLKPLVVNELFETLDGVLERLDFGRQAPDQATETAIYSPTVQRLLSEVDLNLGNSALSLKQICQTRLFINETYAGRLFRREVGVKFSDYVNRCRMQQTEFLLRSSPHLSIAQVAEQVGFGDNYRYFIEVFKKTYETTPKQYQLILRNGNRMD